MLKTIHAVLNQSDTPKAEDQQAGWMGILLTCWDLGGFSKQLCSAAMDVHLLPTAVGALPDAGFAAAGCDRFPASEPLGEAGVAEYDGVIAEPAQVRAGHRHRHR